MNCSSIKEKSRLLLRPFVLLYLKSDLHPNFLTFLGFFLSILTAYLYRTGLFVQAAIGLLLSGMCDAIDGEVARRSGKVTKFGAFLDSVLDRYSEIVIFVGLLIYYMGSSAVVPVVLALTGSLMVSYARARAEALGEECRGGLLLRPERLALLFVGSLFGAGIFVYFLVAIAVLSNLTAVYRIYYTWRRTSPN